MRTRIISATIDVAAPPEEVFTLLADPDQHPRFDGSGTVRAVSGGGSRRLTLGDRFGMQMRNKVPYAVRNTVSEFDDNRRIAWHHPARAVWRYELEPLPTGGTRITESFDWSHSPVAWFIELFGFPARNRVSIRATLARIKEIVET